MICLWKKHNQCFSKSTSEYRNRVALNLGKLDADKTYVNQVRNYPKNTAGEVNFALNTKPNQRRLFIQ